MQTYSTAGRPPSIYSEALPEEEREHCDAQIGCLHALTKYIDLFQLTLALFERGSENLQKALAIRPLTDPGRALERDFSMNWQLVSAKDCALSTYHFCYALNGFDDNFKAAPTMMSLIDADMLDEAKKLYEESFPTYIPMRHGIAHDQERHARVKDISKHAFIGDFIGDSLNESDTVLFGGPIGFTGNVIKQPSGVTQFSGQISLGGTKGSFSGTALNGTVLQTSWKKEIVSLDISRETLRKLQDVREKYYDAFFTLETSTRKIRNAKCGIHTGDSH